MALMGEGMTFTLHHSSDLGGDDAVGVGGLGHLLFYNFTPGHYLDLILL